MRGESSRLNAVNYGYERGVNKEKIKNTDRATECAMTNIGADLLKIASHSEDNDILSPKNLFKGIQEDLSLNAQDDESHCRSALLCRHETNSVLSKECLNLYTLSQISKFALAH